MAPYRIDDVKVVSLKMMLKTLVIVVVIVASLELLLQLAALVVAATGRKVSTEWSTEHTRVLAVGDSNTFGLYLDETESYPSQLQALWNARHPERKIEVINLGYPGTNSYQAADLIEEVLDATQPDVVLLTVGINDIFTAAEYVESDRPGEVDTGRSDLITLIRRYSRLYKLIYIASQGVKAKDLEREDTLAQQSVDQQPAVKERDVLQWSDDEEERVRRVKEFKEANTDKNDGAKRGETMTLGDHTLVMISANEDAESTEQDRGFQHIQKNLASIEKKVTSKGVKLYLLTYAASSSLYHRANREIEAYAHSSPSLNFIDVAAAVKLDCPKSAKCHDLFFDDLHPKAKGYKLVAESIAKRLEGDLL